MQNNYPVHLDGRYAVSGGVNWPLHRDQGDSSHTLKRMAGIRVLSLSFSLSHYNDR